MKFFGNILYGAFILVFLGVTGLFLATLLPIPNNIEIKIVKSGSMEPTILTGSIVVIKPQDVYQIGDVVTFGADTKAEIPTTHRIIAMRTDASTTWFSTKGDANEEADPQMIRADQIIGKVLAVIPYAGYMLDFARQPIGFTFMIGIPAGLLILDELINIYKELRRSRRRRDDDERTGIKVDEVTYMRPRAMDDVFVPIYAPMAHTTPAAHSESRAGKRLVTAFAMYFIFVLTISDTAGATISYFADTNVSHDNTLIARSLDFTVDAGETMVASIGEGDEVYVTTAFTPEAGSLPTAYRVIAEKTGGVEPLCSLLYADATSTPTYTGPLIDLVTGTTTEEITDWQVRVTLPDATGVVENDSCAFDLVYQGWYLLNGQWGYTDEERVNLEFAYTPGGEIIIDPPGLPPDVVLNEFLPNPDVSANGLNLGSDSSDMPLGEWVELYNNEDTPVDVANWYIADGAGGIGNQQAVISSLNTAPATTVIPAHGWLVVYFNASTLNNTGDSIYLYTDEDFLIDFYSYGTPSEYCENEPTPADANVDTSAPGVCSGATVAPNKSYARIPDGIGSFIDPIPTPGGANMPDLVIEVAAGSESQEPVLPEAEETDVVVGSEPAAVSSEGALNSHGGGSNSDVPSESEEVGAGEANSEVTEGDNESASEENPTAEAEEPETQSVEAQPADQNSAQEPPGLVPQTEPSSAPESGPAPTELPPAIEPSAPETPPPAQAVDSAPPAE